MTSNLTVIEDFILLIFGVILIFKYKYFGLLMIKSQKSFNDFFLRKGSNVSTSLDYVENSCKAIGTILIIASIWSILTKVW